MKKQVDFLEEENITENCANSSGKKREIPSLILQDFIRLTLGFLPNIKLL